MIVAVKKPGAEVTREALLAYFEGKVAKWWLPDDAVFVDELPHTATGKLQKLKLREQFRDHVLPGALEAAEKCPLEPIEPLGTDKGAAGGATNGAKSAAMRD